MVFLPADPYLPPLLVNQIDYFFSDDNLVKDQFLRSKMDDQGWVNISVIDNFRRIYVVQQRDREERNLCYYNSFNTNYAYHMVHRGHGVLDTAIILDGHLYEHDVQLYRILRSAAKAKITEAFLFSLLQHHSARKEL